MCGIVGCVGSSSAVDFLLAGLHRLEYRGYDSSGIALLGASDELQVVKSAGRIGHLETLLNQRPVTGRIGIGHTRWATHGAATDVNAHPHLGGNGEVAVVHNGVIENYQPLKARLEAQGYVFRSATDTEVIGHLIADCLRRGYADRAARDSDHAALLAAVQEALLQLRGTYGLALLFRHHPNVIVAARLGSPLVVGVGAGEHFVASDVSALAGYTDKIVYLADHEVALVTAESLRVVHRDRGAVPHNVHVLDLAVGDVGLGGYPHYMLKEIFEQPDSIRNALRGRLDHEAATAKLGGLNLSPQQLRQVSRMVVTACGTSWHAGLVGEHQIEALARIPVEVEYASELRYRNPPMDPNTLVFAITQSGETADTLASLREMRRKGFPTLAICNVVGSTIAQEADGGIYLHAGPEIGVASTKAFTSQCVVLALLALYFGRLRHLSFEAGLRILRELEELPNHVSRALATDAQVREIALKYAECDNFLYLGRQFNFPTALEGALKLKEISYIHAEGYPAAEMKHGPIALIDENMPVVFIAPRDALYEKVMSNLQEVKARRGRIIAVANDDDQEIENLAEHVIRVPRTLSYFGPIVNSIPLQLLAYYTAVARGCNVDQPRNLAKSVTVE